MSNKRKIIILFTAAIMGLLVVIQGTSLEKATDQNLRENDINFFKEIKILKDGNTDLRKEIDTLNGSLSELSNKNSALSAIENETNKYEKLAGTKAIFGPGVLMTINTPLSTIWMIDLINEFFNSGAEAVAINSIRIDNQTAGFDPLPKSQILLNGGILKPPYSFKIIGESSSLINIFELPGGIVSRLKSVYPNISLSLVPKEILQID